MKVKIKMKSIDNPDGKVLETEMNILIIEMKCIEKWL